MKNKTFNCNEAFDRAAGLILDTLEKELGLELVSKRQKTHAALVNILGFYCTPKDGEETVEELLEQLRVRGYDPKEN